MSNHETERLVASAFHLMRGQAKREKAGRDQDVDKLARAVDRRLARERNAALHEAARAAGFFSTVAMHHIDHPNPPLLDRAHWELIEALERWV